MKDDLNLDDLKAICAILGTNPDWTSSVTILGHTVTVVTHTPDHVVTCHTRVAQSRDGTRRSLDGSFL